MKTKLHSKILAVILSLTFILTVIPAFAAAGDITLSKTTLDFGAADAGYSAITPKTFSINNNTGGAESQSFYNMETVLQGNSNFTLLFDDPSNPGSVPPPYPDNGMLDPGMSATVWVSPKTGLAPGEYSETVTVAAYSEPAKQGEKCTLTLTVTFTVNAVAPKINNETALTDEINLSEGYNTPVTKTYSVTGNPAPSISVSGITGATFSGGILTIPTGLSAGAHTAVVTLTNTAGTATLTVSVTVTAVPLINGQTTSTDTVTLNKGYTSFAKAYSVTGNPVPTVNVSGIDGASFANGSLILPDGLGVGTYTAVITAENSKGTAVMTVSVNVIDPPKIGGETTLTDTINLPNDYTVAEKAYTITGEPTPNVTVTGVAGAAFLGGKLVLPTGLTTGSHTVTVTAENASGSAVLTVTVIVAEPVPAVPTGLDAAPGNGQVALTWTKTSGATGYKVYIDGALKETLGDLDSYTVTGLENGTSYDFAVSAFNTSGESAKSDTVNSTPDAVPTVPAGLTATAGNGSVTLTWTKPVGALGYKIYMNGSIKAIIGDQDTYTVSGLINGTSYIFKISAYNAFGDGPMTGEISMAPGTVPTAPTNFSAQPGNGSIILSWTKPVGALGYKIYMNGNIKATIGDVTSYTVSGLTNGTSYTFKISAYNAFGDGSMSGEISAVPSGVPAAPVLSGTPGYRRAYLGWIPVQGAVSYNVYEVLRNKTPNVPIATGILGFSYTAMGLSTSVEYQFVVRAVNADGESAKSNVASVYPTPVSNRPTAPVLTGISRDGAALLSWNEVPDAHAYEIIYFDAVIATVPATNKATASYLVTGLKNGNAYYYRLNAINESKYKDSSSNTVTVTPRKTGSGWMEELKNGYIFVDDAYLNKYADANKVLHLPGEDTTGVTTIVVATKTPFTLRGNRPQGYTNLAVTGGTWGINLTIENLIYSSANDHGFKTLAESRSALHFIGERNTLTLTGSSVITSGQMFDNTGFGAAIGVPEGVELTISGSGSLNAGGNSGIGGGYKSNAGKIIITGGTIASGSGGGAGIGGGGGGSGGNITISGGTVTALSSVGAGIGGGGGGSGANITISGGTVTALSSVGAGIGGGGGGNGGNITISGGIVTASSRDGTGIGGGGGGNGGNITISGGTVIATSDSGAGIGGGIYGNSGKIIISGGTVTATSSSGGGMGGGGGSNANMPGNCEEVTISGGTVTATGYYAGIGGGYGRYSENFDENVGYNGVITVTGGWVYAYCKMEMHGGIGNIFRVDKSEVLVSSGVPEDIVVAKPYTYIGKIFTVTYHTADSDKIYKLKYSSNYFIMPTIAFLNGYGAGFKDAGYTHWQTADGKKIFKIGEKVYDLSVTDLYPVKLSEQTLTDSKTGVKVSGVFEPGAVLTVTENKLHDESENCKACVEIRGRQAAGELILLHDISVSGSHYGEIEVSIPVDESYNGKTVTLLHCKDGTLETQNCTVADGVAKIKTTSFSPFAVVQMKNSDNPKTGDNTPITLLYFIAFSSGAVCILLSRKRKVIRK